MLATQLILENPILKLTFAIVLNQATENFNYAIRAPGLARMYSMLVRKCEK